MTRMKSEFLHHYQQEHGVKLRDRIFANLPRHAPLLSKFAPLLHLRDRIPGLAQISENLLGIQRNRKLPEWSSSPFRDEEVSSQTGDKTVVLFTDTFGTWFEPQGLRDAVTVLQNSGYEVQAWTSYPEFCSTVTASLSPWGSNQVPKVSVKSTTVLSPVWDETSSSRKGLEDHSGSFRFLWIPRRFSLICANPGIRSRRWSRGANFESNGACRGKLAKIRSRSFTPCSCW